MSVLCEIRTERTDDAGLLIRRAWGVSKPKRLYIRIPEDAFFQQKGEHTAVENMALGETPMHPLDGQKSVSLMGEKTTPSKVKEKYKWNNKDRVKARRNQGMPDYTCDEGESL